MIGTIIFCPGPFMHPHASTCPPLICTAKLTAMEHILKVLSYHGQIDAQISTNSGQICPKDPQEHKEKLQRTLLFTHAPERKWSPHSPGMRWDNFSSHTITLFVNGAFIQLSKLAKSGSWHCHLQWQCTRSCVTYLMQERYHIESGWVALHLYAACKFSNHLHFRTMGTLNMDYLYFDTHCISWKYCPLRISFPISKLLQKMMEILFRV